MTKLAKAWLKKYYPIPASECKPEDALDHSIRKWRGLHKSVLKKYRLMKYCHLILDKYDYFILYVAGDSCALCEWLANRCPLKSNRRCSGLCIKEYNIWTKTGNAKPMLTALLAAKKREEK